MPINAVFALSTNVITPHKPSCCFITTVVKAVNINEEAVTFKTFYFIVCVLCLANVRWNFVKGVCVLWHVYRRFYQYFVFMHLKRKKFWENKFAFYPTFIHTHYRKPRNRCEREHYIYVQTGGNEMK